MKNELLDASTPETGSLLIDVLNLSSRLALGVFDKEQFSPTSYIRLMETMNLSVSPLFGLESVSVLIAPLCTAEAQARGCVCCTV